MTRSLRRERCTYATISIIFGLSYVGRYIINVYDRCGEHIGSVFEQEMTYATVLLFEGASMGVLMLFHYQNFRQGSLLSTRKEVKPEYASIMPGEYHFFTDAEVEAHSLADRSSKTFEGSERADREPKGNNL